MISAKKAKRISERNRYSNIQCINDMILNSANNGYTEISLHIDLTSKEIDFLKSRGYEVIPYEGKYSTFKIKWEKNG